MWLLENMNFLQKIVLENKNTWKWKISVFFILNKINFEQNFQYSMHWLDDIIKWKFQ